MTLKTILIFLLFSTVVFSQRLLKVSINFDGKEYYISSVQKHGSIYISSKELGTLLCESFYQNDAAGKIELKFKNYNLKITAKNQFLVLLNKADNKTYNYQLPLSTLIIKNDIFIPAIYTLDFVSMALEKQILFEPKNKNIFVTNHSINTLDLLKASDNLQLSNVEMRAGVKSPYDIYDLQIEEKSNGTLIKIKTNKKIIRPPSSILEGTLFVFLSKAKVDFKSINKVASAGLVRSYKVRNIDGNVQLEFRLKNGYSRHEVFQDDISNEILITIHNKINKPAIKNGNKDKWEFDVVVIDPGHGGRDPGAIGISGVREKTINLGIGLKLGSLIEKNLPEVKVVYTRKTDKAIELYKRGKIANENNGKLFISIHCNSLGKRYYKTRGFEVYLLRPGKTDDAIQIAEKENAVIQFEDNPNRYKLLDEENFILVSMAHSSYMRYSEKFADVLSKEIKIRKLLPERGVKQAGFLVLVGASMPGVLIESGFISNRQDEAFLKSKVGQQEIANSIFDAIKKYREYYNKSFVEEM